MGFMRRLGNLCLWFGLGLAALLVWGGINRNMDGQGDGGVNFLMAFIVAAIGSALWYLFAGRD